MSKRPWAGAAFALGLLLAASVRADEPAGTAPAELDWIPPTCAGFLHVRVHDLLSGPVGKTLVKAVSAGDPKAIDVFERELGIPLMRIDRVTVLLPMIDERAHEPGIVVRVTTTRPYDRRDVLAALKVRDDADRPAKSSSDFHMLPGKGALHFSDERTITLMSGEAGGLALLARYLGPKKPGPLSAALQTAAGKNQIVAGLDLSQVPRVPPEALPDELRGLRTILDAKTATFTANLGDEKSDLAIGFRFGDKADATEGKTTLADGLKALSGFLDKFATDLNRDPKNNAVQLAVLKEIQNGLASAKISQTDADLHVTAQLNSAGPLGVLASQGAELIKTGSSRTQSQINLKQIGLAFHNYADTYQGVLPPAAIIDKNGRPLLSWRVAILPYIEQDNLYKQFHLDEPWDSEHNKALIVHMPKIYMLPGDANKHDLPSTYYQVFVGPHAAFEGKTGLRFPASFPDGTSNTIWTAEAEEAVPWTRPADIEYDPTKMPKIGFHFGDRSNIGFADGSVRALKKSIPEKVWHLLIQRDDGNVIPNYDD